MDNELLNNKGEPQNLDITENKDEIHEKPHH
jgi:hypothetical protein